MTNLIKSRSIPPMGALRPISDPLPFFAYTSFTGWLHPWLVWDFSSHSRIFHSFGNVTIAGEGLQTVTYARQLWPLSSQGSLTCNTYCDTSQPFIVVMSEDPGHSHFLVFRSGAVFTCFNHFCEPRRQALPLRHRGGKTIWWNRVRRLGALGRLTWPRPMASDDQNNKSSDLI